METSFEALGIIPIFDFLLIASLPISSIFYLKPFLSVAFIPSTALFPLSGTLIARYIIIPYEDDDTTIKYLAKAHIYC